MKRSDSSSAPSSDVAFTPAVKAVQERKGSRRAYSAMEKRGGWRVPIDPELAAFVEAQTSVFFATASRGGQPYVQHRGGPPGFLRVLDDRTLAFADFAGNRQYITVGNLSENPKAQLLLIDYARRTRIKIWGEARVEENDTELIASLTPRDYKARAEHAIVFVVSAWDSNCKQHIPQRFEAAEVTEALKLRDERIAVLEAELRRLRAATSSAGG
jgi:predicted pyridoxine 5'-phosphate oxidase superfamily flavin-nucleotide-binding protein